MNVKKKCPYTDRGGHYLDVDPSLDSLECPYCRRPILISHCLTSHDGGTRKTHGISLHIPRGTPDIKDKIIEYVKSHAGKSIADLSRAIGCSPGKMWYILQGMDEIVIEKKGRKCIIGVRG